MIGSFDDVIRMFDDVINVFDNILGTLDNLGLAIEHDKTKNVLPSVLTTIKSWGAVTHSMLVHLVAATIRCCHHKVLPL